MSQVLFSMNNLLFEIEKPGNGGALMARSFAAFQLIRPQKK